MLVVHNFPPLLPGYPFPTAIVGFPGDSGCHAGITRYMHGACLGMRFLPQIVWTSSLKRSNLSMHCELILLLSFTLWFVLSSKSAMTT